MPVTMMSGLAASILLKMGVKSVVSGEKRMWSSTLRPILGRQASKPASSGAVQAASSLMMTAVLMPWLLTSRSLAASQLDAASDADVR